MGIDSHHEKFGLIALANHLNEDGWDEVLVSVRPEALDSTLVGIDVPAIDPALAATNPRYPTQICYDTPSRIDLVARREGSLPLVEAKGQSSPLGAGVDSSSLDAYGARRLLAVTSGVGQDIP